MTPFSANSSCAESARVSGASPRAYAAHAAAGAGRRRWENAWSVVYCRREGTPQDASCSPYNLSLLSPAAGPALGVVFVVLLLATGLSLYPHNTGVCAYIAIPSARRG